jgi:TolB-like protein/Flp pilus assembly protein TadD
MNVTGPDQPSNAEANAGRLDSWKEIATYLRREVRTANLWEKTEGLPVHRHLHSKRGTVFAYKAELDEWRRQRALSRVIAPPISRRSRTMVAVLPFENLSGDTSENYFSDGLTEEMISQLGRVSPDHLGVIARTSSMHYRNSDKGIAAIGADLDVEYILEGSVRRWGERVRITAQLISVKGQSNVWSQSYDREVADIFLLQTEVASRIAASIVAELHPARVSSASVTGGPTSSEAYEAYLKARNYWNQRTEESLLKAVHYFGQALAKDPKLAVAHCGLGDAYNLLAVYGVLPPHEAMPLAKAAAVQALEINPELGEAHACLADVSSFYDWDWDTANQEYQRALTLNPSYATAHHYYGYFLAAIGQRTRALAEIELAHAYDPHSTIISVWKGILLRLAGNYEDAIEVGVETTEREPQYVLARWALGLAYEAAGDMDLALAEFGMAAALSGRSPGMLAALAHNHAIRGQTQAAVEILTQMHALSAKRYVAAYDLATVYLGMGDDEQALNYLEKAFQERSPWIVTLPLEPRVQRLRTSVFFQSLLRKLRLPSDDRLVSAPSQGIRPSD